MSVRVRRHRVISELDKTALAELLELPAHTRVLHVTDDLYTDALSILVESDAYAPVIPYAAAPPITLDEARTTEPE